MPQIPSIWKAAYALAGVHVTRTRRRCASRPAAPRATVSCLLVAACRDGNRPLRTHVKPSSMLVSTSRVPPGWPARALARLQGERPIDHDLHPRLQRVALPRVQRAMVDHAARRGCRGDPGEREGPTERDGCARRESSRCPSPITPFVPRRFAQRRLLPRARLDHRTPHST